MSEDHEFHVNTARDAISLLSQKMYEKYGKEVLPEIEDVWHKLGLSTGEKMKKNLPDTSLVTVGQAFVDGAHKRGSKVDILELTEKKFHLKGYKCAMGLKGKGRELCWACMGSDRGIFEAATEKPLKKMTIVSTIAANDDCCDIIIEL